LTNNSNDNNQDYEQDVDEQFMGKTYEEILEDLKRLNRVTAKAFIPALCVAYKRKHTDIENKEIKKQVLKDCLEIGFWSQSTIEHNFPKWVTNNYPLTRKKFEEVSNSPEEKKNESNVEVFSETAKYIEKEQTQPELVIPSITLPSEGEGPIVLYEDAVRAAEKLWMTLTDEPRLNVTEEQDVLLDHIKPSRQHRLAILKGLDSYRARHYQMVLIWLEKLLQDTLKQCLEVAKEEKEEITR
jgi:hypothetical protein